MKRIIQWTLILALLCCAATAMAEGGPLREQAAEILTEAGYADLAGDIFMQPIDAYYEYMPSTMVTAGDVVLELTDAGRLFSLTSADLPEAGERVSDDIVDTAASRANIFFTDYAIPSDEEIDEVYVGNILRKAPDGETAVRLWFGYGVDGWDYDGAEVSYAVGCLIEVGVSSGRIWRLEMDWPQDIFDEDCNGNTYLYE